VIPPVVASEQGTAQTIIVSAITGLKDYGRRRTTNQNALERVAIKVIAQYGENCSDIVVS
jgi:hypothetical protein